MLGAALALLASCAAQTAHPASDETPSSRSLLSRQDQLEEPRSASLADQTSLGFVVKGDWGSATAAQAAVSAQMCRHRSQDHFADVVTTGDNFYRQDGGATESNYHGPEDCLISAEGHRWRAVWGNHDLARDSTLKVLGAEKHYTWSAGPADFYMLDSNRPDTAQTAWLEARLAASKAKVKIAVFHHPPYTTGTHESNIDVRRSWTPLFERHAVSLVLSGHNHL